MCINAAAASRFAEFGAVRFGRLDVNQLLGQVNLDLRAGIGELLAREVSSVAGGGPGLTLPLWEALQCKLAEREYCSSMKGGVARCANLTSL